MSTNVVADDEELYRRIRNLPGYYTIQDGKCRLSSQAFSDRAMRISVNRAVLCDGDPSSVQYENADAVVSFYVRDVRAIDLKGETDDKQVITYIIDVEPKPLPDNPSHAEIYATPMYASKSTFRRLIEKLARLYESGKAQLLIPPPELRINSKD